MSVTFAVMFEDSTRVKLMFFCASISPAAERMDGASAKTTAIPNEPNIFMQNLLVWHPIKSKAYNALRPAILVNRTYLKIAASQIFRHTRPCFNHTGAGSSGYPDVVPAQAGNQGAWLNLWMPDQFTWA
jgi:hypothetical protein